MLKQGDCLDVLRSLPENSMDSCVTDPPYFLTNDSGSGFMGKSWDSLSPSNAAAEAFFKSMNLDLSTDAGEIAADPASTRRSGKRQSNTTARNAAKGSSDPLSQNQSTSFARQNAITKAEALALSAVLSPSHTSLLEKLPETARFVPGGLFTEPPTRNIVRNIADILCDEPEWLASITHFSATGEAKSPATEGRNGRSFGAKSTGETNGPADDAGSIVSARKSNATTSSHTAFQETIRKVTSLPCVSRVIKAFTKIPNAIPILSEVFHYKWAREVYRVLKPGAHLLAFGGTRTAHRMASSIEDAGFELRDTICWLYGQGFPKSTAIDKQLSKQGYDEDAAKWRGFGSALKPAYEPIVMARKPLSEKNLALNVLKHGAGGINIDATRIGTNAGWSYPNGRGGKGCFGRDSLEANLSTPMAASQGRFPANLVLSHQSTVYYALRSDINPSIKDVIEGFYGFSDVPELQGNIRDDAVQSAERSNVLRDEVQGRNEQGDTLTKKEGNDLRGVQSDVLSLEVQGQGRARDILLADMQGQIPDEINGRAESPVQRKALQGGALENLGKQKNAAHGKFVTVEGRSVDDSTRLRPNNDRPSTRENGQDCKSDDDEPLCIGTSGSDGSEAESAINQVGASPSYQRDQGRQSGREPCHSRQVGAFEGASPNGSAMRDATSRKRILAVPVEQIPPQWLKYFAYSHNEDCVEVGTRKVKASGGDIKAPETSKGIWGNAKQPEHTAYGNGDGTETVAAWECSEGCAVAELDRQSGASRFFMAFSRACGSEKTKGGATFAGKKAANKSENLSTDGLGNKPTGQYLMGTISITKMETRSIISFPILSVSTPNPIGTCTIESENVTSLLTASNIVSVSVAENLSASIHLRGEVQAPITGIAKFAQQTTCENGANKTATIGMPTIETTGARFLYAPKASKSDRNAGLEVAGNVHPTVKSTALMRYLCRLVTPAGGTVLDPFAGSGSTGVAAIREGFQFFGIELDSEYFKIAKARIDHAR